MVKLKSLLPQFVLLIALCLVLPACQGGGNSEGKIQEVAQKGPVPLLANIYVIRDSTLQENLNSVGTVTANEEVELSSEVPGRLVAIRFVEGTVVEKGKVLFKLDDTALQARLRKLQVQLELALKEEQRAAALLARDGISQQEYDRLKNTCQLLEADIELVNDEIDKTEIRAPFAGKTGIRKVSEGALVSPSVQMVNLKDVSKVKIDFAIPEKYASRIRVGQSLQFTVESSSRAYQATLTAIEPGIDPGSRNLLVRAMALNPSLDLFPGASAYVTIPLTEMANSMVIPANALMPEMQGHSVFKLKEGKLVKQAVVAGTRSSNSVQITEGLVLGDTIITSNLLRARQGMAIRIENIIAL